MKRALFPAVGIFLFLVVCVFSLQAQTSDSGKKSIVPGRILVKFKDGVPDDRASELLARRGALSSDVLAPIGVHIVQLPVRADEQAEANAFKGLDEVEFAELDHILAPQAVTPNDTYFAYENYMSWIKAPDAWSSTTGLVGITVATIDTGAYTLHPDLKAKLVPGWNFYDNTSNTNDIVGHGTWAAGVIAPSTNNGFGVAGVCWNCMLMPVLVSDPSGNATESNIASGINFAAANGAKIVNLGYAATDSATVRAAALALWCRGAFTGTGGPCANGWVPSSSGGITVAPSGNQGTFDSSADNPYILTVGGTDAWTDTIWSLSNTGNNVDLTAPDFSGMTTTLSGYGSDNSGTCISAAMVSGVAALVWSVNPNLTPAQVTNILEQTADQKIGSQGTWNSTYGWGRVNALNAVNMAGGGGISISAPVITSSLSANGTAGSAFSYQITATNSPTSYNAAGLPSGLSVNTATGSISGTPTAAGTWSATISATNSGGTGSASLTLSIANAAPPALAITSSSVTNITATSAIVTWTTSVLSNGTVSYGTSSSRLNLSASDGVQGTTHTVVLPNLTSKTRYYYRITATDGTSTVFSATGNFRTSAH